MYTISNSGYLIFSWKIQVYDGLDNSNVEPITQTIFSNLELYFLPINLISQQNGLMGPQNYGNTYTNPQSNKENFQNSF